MKLIAVRPKTDALRHYLELEAECKNASPLDQSAPQVAARMMPERRWSSVAAADLNNTLRNIAMRCAEFEARHMGPFKHRPTD